MSPKKPSGLQPNRTVLAPAADEPSAIFAEAVKRDAELESGKIQPLTEAQCWAGVRYLDVGAQNA